MKKLLRGLVMVALLSTVAETVPAHHSLSAYDITKTVPVEGTVKRFEWTSPHCWLIVTAADGKGGFVEWAFEAGTPTVNYRYGWKRDTFKPGDKLKVISFPTRDGSHHGAIAQVIFPDGRTLEGPISSYLKK